MSKPNVINGERKVIEDCKDCVFCNFHDRLKSYICQNYYAPESGRKVYWGIPDWCPLPDFPESFSSYAQERLEAIEKEKKEREKKRKEELIRLSKEHNNLFSE